MKFHQPGAAVYIPDGAPLSDACARTTHLAVGAHQDDLEFMAFHGIVECFHHVEGRWFTGVTCTNGAGSSRTGRYGAYTDEQMRAVRKVEQNQAASIGRYAAMFQLDHPSSVVKNPADTMLRDDLLAILQATRPKVVYTHNLADKHDTHIGVVIPLIQAIRALPADRRPAKVYGCEVWRALDWMEDHEKVAFDVTGYDNLAAAANGVFDSQIAGGKRYDLAVIGRRRANATFFASHGSDQADQIIYAMDITAAAVDEKVDLVDFTLGHIDRFRADVRAKLSARLGR